MNWQSNLGQDLLGATVVAVCVMGIFVACELLHRFANADTEYTRKLSHLGSGAVVLALPWLVQSPWVVLGLAGSMAFVLVLGKRLGLLGSIHSVERKTSGAYYYPFAVALVFWLSGGDPVLYCIPILIMAVADTGAAIMGKESGHTRYQVLDGERSLEGSAAFFGLAFAIVLGGLALAGASAWPDVLLVALVVALMTTAMEAISIRGSDNILIPYVGWLVLERTLRLGLDELSAWMSGMLLALFLLVLTYQRARLTVAGAVASFVLVTFAYALAGPEWVIPLVALYGLHLIVSKPSQPLDYDIILPATAASLLMLLLYAHTGSQSVYVPYLVTVGLGAVLAVRPPARLSGLLAPPTAAFAGGSLAWVFLS
jgi:phytol kinase